MAPKIKFLLEEEVQREGTVVGGQGGGEGWWWWWWWEGGHIVKVRNNEQFHLNFFALRLFLMSWE